MTDQKQPVQPLIDMTLQELASVLCIGLGVGVVAWVLQIVLARYVFTPFMCQGGQVGCGAIDGYASAIAALVTTIGGLVALVRQRVYRPLLVVLAALISLWGLYTITNGIQWAMGLSVFAVLYAAAYGLFTWLTRIRSFLLCIISIVVALAFIRLALG